MLYMLQLNVIFKMFVLLLHVQEVCGSDLVPEASYLIFFIIFSGPPVRCRVMP
jgi:hypothetical protein